MDLSELTPMGIAIENGVPVKLYWLPDGNGFVALVFQDMFTKKGEPVLLPEMRRVFYADAERQHPLMSHVACLN